MPRPTRLNLAGIPQHVTQRGNNRQACFFTNKDYMLYLSLLNEACHRHHCDVHTIELNPSCADMVNHLSEYPWSSFKFNALGQSCDLVTPHATWLALGDTNANRSTAYLDLFESALDQHTLDAIRYGVL